MHRKFGVDVKLTLPRVPYKETITEVTKAEYKHKKQSGGHGQYGHVCLQLEPLPRGSRFEFTAKIFGGAIPSNYIPAVEKGVNEAKQEGVLAGYPAVDIKVTLYHGSFHAVDSSDIAFKMAGSIALKEGVRRAAPILLESVMQLEIVNPEEFLGDVIGDLSSRRGHIKSVDTRDGMATIHAFVPLAEAFGYTTTLRSLTQGRATHSMEFYRYQELPREFATQIQTMGKGGG